MVNLPQPPKPLVKVQSGVEMIVVPIPPCSLVQAHPNINHNPNSQWSAAGGGSVPCLTLPPEAHLYPLTNLGQSQQNLPSGWDPDQELQVL